MPVMVRFRTLEGVYAVPVASALEVRGADSVVPLPSPAAGIAGIIERHGITLPVVRALGGGSAHVLVIGDEKEPVGLLVEEVTGILTVSQPEIGPAPPGQDGPLVDGVVHDEDGMMFVLDVDELVRRVKALELEEV